MPTNDKGNTVIAVLSVITLILSTILFFIPIFIIGMFKLIPIKWWQTKCTKMVDSLATLWCAINNTFIHHVQSIDWQIQGLDTLNAKGWYLVTANHQSWLDIVILQKLFNRKIPVLKFFIKDQLKWVPFLGFAWWAMGCPFMKRYSRDYLEKNPQKKLKDLRATQKSVEQFRRIPTSIINFVEGTRFHPQKQRQQSSPYEHLLKPRAGGISYVLSTMGQKIDSLLDVTILYPDNNGTLWNFLCRRIRTIKVTVRQLPIPNEFLNTEALKSDEGQAAFRQWLNEQWYEKDRLISTMKS